MVDKIKITLTLIIVLCVLFATTVFATIEAMPGEEIDTGEGFENVMPTSEDASGGDLLPIDPRTEDIEPISENIANTNSEAEPKTDAKDKTTDIILYVGGGIIVLGVIALIFVAVKNKK